jgi:general secretion pathway protein D
MMPRLFATALLLVLLAGPVGAQQKVTLQFVDVELKSLAKFVSEATGKNFIFDERLKGKVTIMAPEGLHPEEVLELFASVLELKGFALVPSGLEAMKIVPLREAKQKGMEVAEQAPVKDSYQFRLFALRGVSGTEAVRFLKPLISREGYIASLGRFLLVVDSGLNIEKVGDILSLLEEPLRGPELVLLKHASAGQVARILNEGLKAEKGKVAGKALAEERLNAVVLFGPPETREAMKGLIALLDVPAQEAQGGINVYFVKYGDAQELAKTLREIVKPAPKKPASVSITADVANNALVIVAPQAEYQELLRIIKQLDRKKRQVFVEAMIVEASVDSLKELGLRWRATVTREGEPVFIGGVGTIDSTVLLGIIQGLSGLSAGGLANFFDVPVTTPDGQTTTLTVPGYAALFSLGMFKDAVNVLSTPQILTSDNEEAEIVVGENVPFITKREADPTRTLSVFSTIERKDVGITLRIKPHITEGDFVRLEIYQEISAVKEPPAALAEAILTTVGPTTTKRSTRTSVVVKDGQTIVIGGLMLERQEVQTSKVPLLGDIPLLGLIFRYKSVSKRKTNLLVFIRPKIIRDSQDIAQITSKKKEEFKLKRLGPPYKAGQLLVKFQEGVSDEEALRLIRAQGAEVLKRLKDRLYLIKLPPGVDVLQAQEAFSRLPEVRYAEPNYILRTP